MNLPTPVQSALLAARRRHAAIVALFGLPLVAVAMATLWRDVSAITLIVTLAIAGLFLFLAWRLAPSAEPRRLARQLDTRADLQDSADLLFARPDALNPLQQLQRERLLQVLARAPADLRPAWPRRALAWTWALSALLVAAAIWLPPLQFTAPQSQRTPAAMRVAPAVATDVELASAQLAVSPPAYTAIAASKAPELSAKVPEGSRLEWTLQLSPQPEAVDLVFHDGQRLPLQREGETWRGTRTLARSALYRIVPAGPLPLRDDTLHRLDAIADQPPQIRVVEPERSLSLATPGQRQWSLAFEASDDHGLGNARLVITHAQGSGEQVTVKSQTVAIAGEGERKLKRYARRIDLGAIGLAEGDDLIVRLEVNDNRAPSPQSSRSASYILRWPMPPAAESTGMEGLVKKALPAYFRSQRQIIIDAEALVADKPRIGADDFLLRSNNLGVDQRLLRLRYGQFLGEETSGEPEAPPGMEGAEGDDHGDDHGAAEGYGQASSTLELYGHTHDEAEAATLLDPETRALLKQALDAMWLSEGELRVGEPKRALPHAYRALGFIKQVQQASRIYLARVGLELPPIDETRRMTGKREGLGDRRTGLAAWTPTDSPALPLWQALAEPAGGDAELSAFADWLRANETKLENPLDLVAALDALRAKPDCGDCRRHLRALLWPLLPRAIPATPARAAADARGQAYLDALSKEPRQ